MLRGLPASIVMHASIVGLFYTGGTMFGWFTPKPVEVEARDFVQLDVELVTVGELNNIAPIPVSEIVPEETPDEIVPPEAEEPEPETPPEDPEIVDEDIPEADVDTAAKQVPEETVPEDVVPDLDAEPEPKDEEPEDTPEPETPQPNVAPKPVDPLDALLNQADSTFSSERQTRKRSEAPKPRPAPKKLQDEYTPPTAARRGAGERKGNTARLEMLLYNQIYPCWDDVRDQPGWQDLNVRLRVDLDERGNLSGEVELIEPTREPLGRSPMRVAVERARRAVQKCAPYSLPREEYAVWKEINVNLGPKFEATNANR